ncbi:hypothetical protein P171DRAFT_526869 [Karstenula rhodostoma CBS 690.94]|uniref:Uncharacterized protein n=1 Tax=Karstenula rhodostoma CBS 690.94 TaxID=1392251 RepID=A0A9P4U549_9PLEO|nr:hypothetical protein P171DRAFT_526869 [Karstenula rhodostoma CBS 690.94]
MPPLQEISGNAVASPATPRKSTGTTMASASATGTTTAKVRSARTPVKFQTATECTLPLQGISATVTTPTKVKVATETTKTATELIKTDTETATETTTETATTAAELVETATETATEMARKIAGSHLHSLRTSGRRIMALINAIEGSHRPIKSGSFARYDITWNTEPTITTPLLDPSTRSQFAKVLRDVGLVRAIEKHTTYDRTPIATGSHFYDLAIVARDACRRASSDFDRPGLSLPLIQMPVDYDFAECRILDRAIRANAGWNLLTVHSLDGDEESDILTCSLTDFADVDPSEQALLPSEVFSILVLLHRQLWLGYHVCNDAYKYNYTPKPVLKNEFTVTIVTFTRTHIRVHEACIGVPSDDQQNTSSVISVVRRLSLENSLVRGDGPLVEENWLDILSYMCFLPDADHASAPEEVERSPERTDASS